MQLTSDGNRVYIDAVEEYMGGEVDYAQLIKQYGESEAAERAYSPAKCLGTKKRQIDGNPDMSLVSTSYAERQNLNIRMKNRRFTRLTNGFSKKVENHAHAISLYFVHYNFVRIHKTLRVTPAMQAGLASHAWTIEELIQLLDRTSAAAA